MMFPFYVSGRSYHSATWPCFRTPAAKGHILSSPTQVLRHPHSAPSSAAPGLLGTRPTRPCPRPPPSPHRAQEPHGHGLLTPRQAAGFQGFASPSPISIQHRSSSSACPDRRRLRCVAADPGVVVGGAQAHHRGDGAGVPGHGGSCCSAAWLALLPAADGSDSAGEMECLWICLLSFCVWFQTADIDEKSIRRGNPDDLVMVLAEAKVGTRFPAFFPSIGETMLCVVLCCSFRASVLQTREFCSYIQWPMWCFVWFNCKCVAGCCKFLL